MMRMADGPPANLPPGLDAYAGYVDNSGIGVTFPTVKQEHPTAHLLSIATHGAQAMCADVETGAMSSWAGYDYGYCAVSNVNTLIARFGRPKRLWTAHYDPALGAHICSPACWPGLVTSADGTQWVDHGGWDESLLNDNFFLSTTGGDVPAPTDVVASWSVPGSGGSQYFNLHADGGLFAEGGAVPTQLEYIACANDGARYHFGPQQFPEGNPFSYPGLPAADKTGTRYFVTMQVLSYEGKTVGAGPEGPPGESSVPALKAALQAAVNSVP